MKRNILFAYQILAGFSDTSAGLFLIFAPTWALAQMRLHVPAIALPFISYIGAFVLSVGIAGFYGALLTMRAAFKQKLEVVWLLTAITRGLVAAFILAKILSGALEDGWIMVAITDGAFCLLQVIGLAKNWLCDGTT